MFSMTPESADLVPAATTRACSGLTTMVTLPFGVVPGGKVAEIWVPDDSFTVARSPATEITSASMKFVSPMKSATKRSAGRS